RPVLHLGRARRLHDPRRAVMAMVPIPSAAGRTASSFVPFDHAARFELTGKPGNVLQDVISVGVDGAFVAVAIGYGLEEDRGRQARVFPVLGNPAAGLAPGDVQLNELPVPALIEGFRLNPRFEGMLFKSGDEGAARARGARLERTLSDEPIAPGFFSGNRPDDPDEAVLFERVKRTRDFSFLLSIVDSGTG